MRRLSRLADGPPLETRATAIPCLAKITRNVNEIARSAPEIVPLRPADVRLNARMAHKQAGQTYLRALYIREWTLSPYRRFPGAETSRRARADARAKDAAPTGPPAPRRSRPPAPPSLPLPPCKKAFLRRGCCTATAPQSPRRGSRRRPRRAGRRREKEDVDDRLAAGSGRAFSGSRRLLKGTLRRDRKFPVHTPPNPAKSENRLAKPTATQKSYTGKRSPVGDAPLKTGRSSPR
jgi:hypothetical protein